MIALILAASLAAPAPADTLADYVEPSELTIPVIQEWRAAYERLPRWIPPPPPVPQPEPESPTAERWRSLVASYFAPGDVDRALAIIECESHGLATAKNPTSSASGLFQHLGRYWAERSAAAGWAGASIFDPEANVAVAAWLRQDGWHHWNPSRGCWR